MEFLTNPWIVGIGSGIISSFLVSFGIQAVFAKKDMRRFAMAANPQSEGQEKASPGVAPEDRPQPVEIIPSEHDPMAPIKDHTGGRKLKLLSYGKWLEKEHPIVADPGVWGLSYTCSLLLFGIPLLLVIPLHLSLREMCRNEYFLYAAEQCLSAGDYLGASQHAFKLSCWGVAKEHVHAAVMSIAAQAEAAGDQIRATQLRSFAESL